MKQFKTLEKANNLDVDLGGVLNSDQHLAIRNDTILLFASLLILIPAIYFTCFWKLGVPSLSRPDEHIHITVTQEMMQSGKWWAPTLNGFPYFNKPPFKMWLSMIPVSIFGQSKFSFRILDAALGGATTLLTFFFVRHIFASTLTGLFTSLMLLGCRIYIFKHTVRVACQDSMLVFLSTLAIITGWYFLKAEGKQKTILATAGGGFVGLAVLTKSVGGFLPLIVLGIYALLTKQYRQIISKNGFIVIFLSLLIPTLYYLPHLLSNPMAKSIMLEYEIQNRVVDGYHFRHRPYYYINLILYNHTVPLLLFLAGSLLSVFTRDRRLLFLFIWAAGVLVLFSLIPSRLSHYIAPAFPAMAALSAYALVWASKKSVVSFRAWWNGHSGISLIAIGLCLFTLYGISAISFNLGTVITEVNALETREETDLVTWDLRSHYKRADKIPILFFKSPPLAKLEEPYWNMLSHKQVLPDTADLKLLLAEERPAFIVTNFDVATEFFSIKPFSAYRLIRPYLDRESWLVILAYAEDFIGDAFTPQKQVIDFGSKELETINGISEPGTLGKLKIRHAKGERASFIIRGDQFLNKLGSTITINLGASSEFPVDIELNGRIVTSISPSYRHLSTHTFAIPKDVWMTGKNVFVLHLRNTNSYKDQLILNWISVRLGTEKSD